MRSNKETRFAHRIDAECVSLIEEVSGWSGRLAVQVGMPEIDLGRGARYVQWIRAAERATSGSVQAKADALPFPEASVDAVFIMHALEETNAPLAVLEEAARVLRGEGRLVVVGFRTAFGLVLRSDGERRDMKGSRYSSYPIGPLRLRWLVHRAGLEWDRSVGLGCTPIERRMPPLCRRFLAGSYAAIAVKRVEGITVLRPQWKRSTRERHAVIPGAGRAG